MSRRTTIAATVVAISFAAAPARATVFIGTQVADARLYGAIAGDPLDTVASDAGTRPGTIIATAQLFERRTTAGGDPALVRGTSSVVANLIGSERGRVTFRRTLSVVDAAVTGTSDYIYFFTTDAPTAFDLNWGVSAYGAAFDGREPAQIALIRQRDTGAELLRTEQLGDGADGMSSVLLGPGSYEFRVQDARAPGAGAALPSGGLSSEYSFSFRAVPEPATWATMMLGFVAAGAAIRRRRRGVIAAA